MIPSTPTSDSSSPTISRADFLRLGGAAVAGLGVAGAASLTQVPDAHALSPAFLAGVTVQNYGKVTGSSITGTWKIGGTDLGISTHTNDGRIITIFGDTWEDDRALGTKNWRSPVALYSSYRTNPTSKIQWTSAAGPNPSQARQLVDYSHAGGQTFLPTDAITLGDGIFVWMTFNQNYPRVKHTEIWSSHDNGRTWRRSRPMFDGNYRGGILQMVSWAFNPADKYVYIISSRFDRSTHYYMFRVPSNDIFNTAKYQPWGWTSATGWKWGNNPTPVLEGTFGEMSLRRLSDGNWVLSSFNAEKGAERIELRRLLNGPTSNLFTAPRATVVTNNRPELGTVQIGAPYGGFILPGSTINNIHLLASQWWGNERYNTQQVRVRNFGNLR